MPLAHSAARPGQLHKYPLGDDGLGLCLRGTPARAEYRPGCYVERCAIPRGGDTAGGMRFGHLLRHRLGERIAHGVIRNRPL